MYDLSGPTSCKKTAARLFVFSPTQFPFLSSCIWTFPPAHTADENGLVGAGADLEPGTLLSAYGSGLFPMPLGDTLGWWSPDPRGVLPLSYLRVGRSLRRACRDFDIRVDHAFDQVIDACASPVRPHGWIDANIREAYLELHRLGWAHSVETWQDDELVGGLYGVCLGGAFFGESMFATANDASKVAFVHLVNQLRQWGIELVDCQVHTDHLERFGARRWPRERFLEALERALEQPTRRGPWRLEEQDP